jgi:hypothetical protein
VALDNALQVGLRGLPGGDSLYRLLRRERGAAEPRGRRPQVDRRAALRLRARGLSLAEIGRRLGISKQGVHQLLRKAKADPPAR